MDTREGVLIILGVLSYVALFFGAIFLFFYTVEFIKRKEVNQMITQSMTIIFNVIALIVAVAGGFGFIDFKPSADITALAAGIVALINIFLRLRKLPPDQESFR